MPSRVPMVHLVGLAAGPAVQRRRDPLIGKKHPPAIGQDGRGMLRGVVGRGWGR